MNSHTKSLKLYLYLFLVALASTVTLRTVALLYFFEAESYYFSSGTLISVANALTVALSLLCASYLFTGSTVRLRASFTSPATYVPTGLTATSLVFMLRRLVVPTAPRIDLLSLLAALLAMVSVVHFFLNAFLTEERTRLRAGFAIGTVMFLSLYSAIIYFNTALPYNAPAKLVDEMAYLFSALFFLYEARISLGRSKWRGYIAFGLVAGILTAYSSIPSLILYFVDGVTPSLSVEESVLTLSLFIFITFRLVLILSLRDVGEPKAITAMESYAENRQRIIDDAERVRPQTYAVQMTIDDLARETGEGTVHLLGEDAEQTEEQTAEESAEDRTDSVQTENEPTVLELVAEQERPEQVEEVSDNQIAMDIIDAEDIPSDEEDDEAPAEEESAEGSDGEPAEEAEAPSDDAEPVKESNNEAAPNAAPEAEE